MGITTESTETIVETTSSKILTGTFPTPAVVAVTAGRIIALLTTWTPPATNRPQASESMGETSVRTLALAANTIAPAAGRMKDWIISLTWFTAGNLSAKNSTSESTINKPMIHQLESASQGCCSFNKLVNLANRATTSKGM